jgi:hypothetical protein
VRQTCLGYESKKAPAGEMLAGALIVRVCGSCLKGLVLFLVTDDGLNHGLLSLDQIEIAVLDESGSGRDEMTHDDVFLEATEQV